jgi:hypothetical protein
MESHEVEYPPICPRHHGREDDVELKREVTRTINDSCLLPAVATLSIAVITFAGTVVASAQSSSVPASSTLEAQVQESLECLLEGMLDGFACDR